MKKVTKKTNDTVGKKEARRGNSGPQRSGLPLLAGDLKSPAIAAPDPEVPEKKPRRYYTAKYKLQILAEADKCTEPGQLGTLLRREGLYSSNLTTWRRQKEQGMLDALSPKKRGPKKVTKNHLTQQVARLEKENRQLKVQLKKAETIIEVQKKISELLGMGLGTENSAGSI